jgi:nitroimidazol reductase NimA-like FMN-containing flavoprotein (pyridoxamine 5'-phosphate oxidase superfamily)
MNPAATGARLEGVAERAPKADPASATVPPTAAACTVSASGARAPQPERTRHRRGEARDMSPAEIDALLRSARWAVLATAEDHAPWAVPVAFGWDGTHCWIATGPGRKADNIARDPGVCLTVVDVEADRDGAGGPPRAWRSVVLRGSAETVNGVPEKLRGFLALRRQFHREAPISAADLRRFREAGLLRIAPAEVSGRALGT